jgi:hypothetical protein
MAGADNITAIKQINDFAICPMLDTENQVIGLYYFYNASQGSVTMNAIKKMKAISKLLGGCLSLVSVTTEQLMMKVGLQSKFEVLQD